MDPDTKVRSLKKSKKETESIEDVFDLQGNGLVDKFFGKNKKSSRLSLKSDPSRGYVIDYDGKFRRYFEKGEGGWKQFYKENPNAHGRISISLPAFDEKSGLVLVYKGTWDNWRLGRGYLILYKYKDGKLKEVKRIEIWGIIT